MGCGEVERHLEMAQPTKEKRRKKRTTVLIYNALILIVGLTFRGALGGDIEEPERSGSD